ncbi:MAG: Rrf2 family transcriptional regulator [Bacteroidia bacterium]
MLSKTSEYAIKSLIYLESKPGRKGKVGVEEIATAIRSPKSFTAKVLQRLAKAGLISSLKGPAGGFSIARDRDAISLMEVILAMEGETVFQKCGLGLDRCSAAQPCPLHHEYEKIRNDFRDLMARQTIQMLAAKLTDGTAQLRFTEIDI